MKIWKLIIKVVNEIAQANGYKPEIIIKIKWKIMKKDKIKKTPTQKRVKNATHFKGQIYDKECVAAISPLQGTFCL